MDSIDELRRHVRSCVEDGRHLGVQLYASLDGEVLIDEAYGEAAPGVPLSRRDAVPWLCLTKLLGAVAMAELMVRHGLKPASRVAEVIPEFGASGKDAVTIGQLMSHSVPYALENEHAFYRQVPATILATLCALPLDAPPGSRARYSPVGSWVVVAEMVGRLSGVTFAEHVHRSVLKPLEMSHTVFGTPPDGDDGRPAPLPLHRWTSDDPSADLFPAPLAPGHPSTGAHGPAGDLGRLLECLLGKGRWRGREVLGPDAVEFVTTAWRRDLPDPYFLGMEVPWGMGACVDPRLLGAPPGSRVVGHTSANCGIAVADHDRRLVVSHVATNEAFESIGPKRLESRVVRELYGITAGL